MNTKFSEEVMDSLFVAADFYKAKSEQQWKREHQGFIYVLSVHDFVKIGFTENAKTMRNRIMSMQVGNPYKISVIWIEHGDWITEQSIHHAFQRFSISGEWYPMNARIRILIDWGKQIGFKRMLESIDSGQVPPKVREDHIFGSVSDLIKFHNKNSRLFLQELRLGSQA